MKKLYGFILKGSSYSVLCRNKTLYTNFLSLQHQKSFAVCIFHKKFVEKGIGTLIPVGTVKDRKTRKMDEVYYL